MTACHTIANHSPRDFCIRIMLWIIVFKARLRERGLNISVHVAAESKIFFLFNPCLAVLVYIYFFDITRSKA